MRINIVHNSYRYLIQACYVYYKRDAYNFINYYYYDSFIMTILRHNKKNIRQNNIGNCYCIKLYKN